YVTDNPKRRMWLLGVARRADPDDWRNRLRDPKGLLDKAALEALAAELLHDEGKLAKYPPQLLMMLGIALVSAKRDAVPILTPAQAYYPNDFWLNIDLANAFRDAKRLDEAVSYYRAAVAIRQGSAAARNNLGSALHDKGQMDDAIRECRAAIAL